jgi:outer membrane protein OmpA-like peptidoglycan-associated protein
MKTTSRILTLVLLPALLLAPLGCETMSEHRTASGAVIGTATGAVLGGVIGHQSGHRTEGAAIGAAAGALLGAGTGYWLDRRAQKMRALEDANTTIQTYPAGEYNTTQGPQYVPEHIVLRLNDTMLFQRGSSAISPQGSAKLDEIAALLAENPNERIIIRGYTSSEGEDEYNYKLSQRRAETVAGHFVGKGLNPGRLTVVGMGESNPIASNDTEAGRAQNRRVEIEVFPPEQSAGGGY